MPNKIKIARKTILVGSGKGGVGKSTLAVNLALALAHKGFNVGIADLDIYGPSIPHMLAITEKPETVDNNLVPITKHNIQSISIGFLVDPSKANLWRGPILHKAIKQLLLQTQWSSLDYLLIDLPPGTGDILISIAQAIEVLGSILVSTPQQIALLDVQKIHNACMILNVQVLGIIENMSYYILPSKQHIFPFGSDKVSKFAEENSIPFLGKLPLIEQISTMSDAGSPPYFDHKIGAFFDTMASAFY